MPMRTKNPSASKGTKRKASPLPASESADPTQPAAAPAKPARGRKAGGAAAAAGTAANGSTKSEMRKHRAAFKRDLDAHNTNLKSHAATLRLTLSSQTAALETMVINNTTETLNMMATSRNIRQAVTTRLSKLKRSKVKRVKIGDLMSLIDQLDGAVQDAVTRLELAQQSYVSELELRRQQQIQLRAIEEQAMKMQHAMLAQLDQLTEMRIRDNAVHPYAADGFAGRYMRSAMPTVPSRQRRSYAPRLAAAAALAEVTSANAGPASPTTTTTTLDLLTLSLPPSLVSPEERSERVIPATGFMSDGASQRYYRLLAQKKYFDSQAMAVPPTTRL